jgi:hypothetical protein
MAELMAKLSERLGQKPTQEKVAEGKPQRLSRGVTVYVQKAADWGTSQDRTEYFTIQMFYIG